MIKMKKYQETVTHKMYRYEGFRLQSPHFMVKKTKAQAIGIDMYALMCIKLVTD